MANERRVYGDALGGYLDAAITLSDTTISSPAFASLPVIDSTNHMALRLDPIGWPSELTGETIWVTSHASGDGTITALRGQSGTTARAHAAGVMWVHSMLAEDVPIKRVSNPTNGVTRTSGTYGQWSTPWTLTVPVAQGQVVDLSVLAAIKSSLAEFIFLAIRRGSTTIYEAPHNNAASNVVQATLGHLWTDEAPGSGDITYEIYVASNGGGTVTLLNGATLDTTVELLQGKSQFTAEARWPR